ncbi:Elongator complex protein 4 [Apostasia shenzhenica]|uniref:Elongator complex protein 4 n=1 Tax=Apostasia shenzhenica TaxID=1088818 RepID=A0A2I0AT22_9ASPA|nr:Elongator complex protein 4 [Apostasia shenzhenica]
MVMVMVMQDAEALHHLLLLWNFMAQSVVHRQPLFFVVPAEEPRTFLGTLPAPVVASKRDGPSADQGRFFSVMAQSVSRGRFSLPP